jgi:hypothetical protein
MNYKCATQTVTLVTELSSDETRTAHYSNGPRQAAA